MVPRVILTGAVLWVGLCLCCHLEANMLPTRAPFLPFSPFLAFENYPPLTFHVPRISRGHGESGELQTPSLCHHLVF